MKKIHQSYQETTYKLDREFLWDAVMNGDKEAIGILAELDKLDQEYDSIYTEIDTRQWLPRNSHNEHRAYYKFIIPRMKRLKAIPEDRLRIIHSQYKLDKKKPQIYLQTLKRRKKENSL